MPRASDIQDRTANTRRVEDRYHAVLHAMDVGFCIIEVIFDPAGRPIDYRFLEVNSAFERHTGLRNAEGKRIRELVPDLAQHWFDIYGEVALTGQSRRFEERAEAMKRWFDVHVVRLDPPEDRHVAVIFKDITQRRMAQEALRAREEQLRLIFENATEYAILVTDLDRRVTSWNYGAQRLTGYSEEEIIGQSGDILFTPEDRASGAPLREVQRALEHGRATNERWHVRKNCTRFWGSGFMFCLRDENNVPQGFLKIMRDRTAETMAEKELRKSEERLRLAIETSRLGTWEYNPTTQIAFADEQLRELIGVGPGVELTLATYMDIVHPDDRARFSEVVERVFRGESGAGYHDEYRIVRARDGVVRWVRADGRVHSDAEGKPIHIIGTLLDVTDLVSAREVLARRSEELERVVEQRTAELRDTVQQLETFSYSLVHDMRAPLRSVRSFAGVLMEEYGPRLDDTARDYLRRLENSVARMDALITDVLAYSRVNASETTLQPVDLEHLVRDTVEQYPQFQECRGCVHVQSPLPVVLGNRALLIQCVSNLLGNAIKFVPPGRTPRVIVRAESMPDRARIWFEDNGIGIASEYRDRIFGLFQRLHRVEEYAGTGVGLAIVKKAVERMRGRVGVESALGEGSRFWIEVPVPDRR